MLRDDKNKGKDRFIALNILPSRNGNSLKDLENKIDLAQTLGFTHVWINPINSTNTASTCVRKCLETGKTTTLFNSLYAPIDPRVIHSKFPEEKMKLLIQKVKNNGMFFLVDFVWKHVENQSQLLKNKGWKGKQVKDVTEYNLDIKNPKFSEIIDHLKEAIDLFLSPSQYGFSGLRMDAASCFSIPVREALLGYIKSTYPDAIILEEVLFDITQENTIATLAKHANENSLYSDFVTSNLYYQKPDCFGALPHPEKMGDSKKLQLSNQNGISFTGNHDHFSAGWAILLGFAAEKVMNDDVFLSLIKNVTVSTAKNDPLDPKVILETIDSLAKKEILVEELDADKQACIRYLLPFANELARVLLDPSHVEHEKLLSDFQLALHERISNRTLASMSGYFMLYSEIVSPFETQRIFSNKKNEPLALLLLTAEDLLNQIDLTKSIISKMEQDKIYYPNMANFKKTNGFNFIFLPKNKKNNNNTNSVSELNALRLWLPHIIDYLRNNPSENNYTYYKNNTQKHIDELNETLDTKNFVSSINAIFQNLSTLKCSDYHTFTSLDKYKIVVRRSAETTDIIILNLRPQAMMSIEDLDLEKIALWFQSRLYPPQDSSMEASPLSSPFDDKDIVYAPDSYSWYWKNKVGDAFDKSYASITGESKGHQTHLHLGYNISLSLTKYDKIKVITHLKSTTQMDNEVFHCQKDMPLTLDEFPSLVFSLERESSFKQIKHLNLFANTSLNNDNDDQHEIKIDDTYNLK